jgi:hypothetical protein
MTIEKSCISDPDEGVMSYWYKYNESLNFLYIKFTGDISSSEEKEAVQKSFQENPIKNNPKILADRRESRFTSSVDEVREHIVHVGKNISKLGMPKVANVVSRDYDYGMIRMFEILAESKLIHIFQLFRDMSEACQWLGIDENQVPESEE